MTFSGQDIGDIFKYPIKDPQWFSKLILQGALIMFLSCFLIGIPFMYGFMIALTQRAIANDSNLPDWSNWGLYWRLGWRAIATQLVYLLPLIVLWFFVGLFFVGGILLTSYDEAFAVIMIPTTILYVLCYGLTLLYSLALSIFIQPTYTVLLAVGAPIRACFRFKEFIWPYFKANIANLILGFLLMYLVGMIASVGMFFLLIGYLFTLPYAMAAMAYVHGLIYRQSPIQYKA